MKRFLYMLLPSILLLALLVGCSSEEGTTSKTEVIEKPISTEVTSSTQQEILKKAEKDFDKLDGISFKYGITATIESRDVKQTHSGNFDIDMSLSPYKYSGKGIMETLGMEFPIEVYEDENYSYMFQGGEWIKTKLDEEEKEYDFADELNKLRTFLEKDKNASWAKVTRKDNVYYYDLNLGKSNNNDIKDEMKSNAKESLEVLNELGLKFDIEDIDLRVDKYNVKLEIQDKEPMLKKFSIEYSVLAPEGNNLFEINVKEDFEIKGEYDKRIDIPEEAIKAPETLL